MSVLPDVGSELPTVYVGNGALDVVGLRVVPSCLPPGFARRAKRDEFFSSAGCRSD